MRFTTLLLWACTPSPGDTGGNVEDGETATLAGAVSLPEDTVRDAPLAAAAVVVHFGAGPTVGPTLASAAVDTAGAFTLEIPHEPPATDLTAYEPTVPDFVGALYAVVVFEDENADGAWVEGEPLRGLAMDGWLSWTHGSDDWPDGWRLVDLGLAGQHEPNRCLTDTTAPLHWREDSGYPVFSDLDDGVTVPLRGLPANLTMGGTVASLPSGVTGLVGLPYGALSGEDLAPVYDQSAAAGPFSVSLTEEPPAEDDTNSDPDWRYAAVVNLLTIDRDGDLAWSEGDDLEGTSSCFDGQWVYARYTRPVSTWRGYRFLDCYGGTVGWRVATSDPDSGALIYLTSAQSLALEVDPETCRLD